jgi:hypothetical protein
MLLYSLVTSTPVLTRSSDVYKAVAPTALVFSRLNHPELNLWLASAETAATLGWPFNRFLATRAHPFEKNIQMTTSASPDFDYPHPAARHSSSLGVMLPGDNNLGGAALDGRAKLDISRQVFHSNVFHFFVSFAYKAPAFCSPLFLLPSPSLYSELYEPSSHLPVNILHPVFWCDVSTRRPR